jgi:hypothetical protein
LLRHFQIYQIIVSELVVKSFLIKAIVIEIFIYKIKRKGSNLRKITYLYINPLESRRFINKHLISYNPLILKYLFVK